jgi:hypothetical protein
MHTLTSRTIDQLVVAIYGDSGNLREKHVFTEALRGLVRLAKAEQRMEIRRSAAKSVPVTEGRSSRAEAKMILSAIKALG